MGPRELQGIIDSAWETREALNPGSTGEVRRAVEDALAALDSGKLRVAEKEGGAWRVNQWLKKAVLLSFRLNDMTTIPGGPGDPAKGGAPWFDKVPLEVRGLGRAALPRRRLPRGTGCDRAPFGLYRAGRRADALLRQCRRLRRQRHHDRHLGDGRLLRADRQELPPLRRRRHRRRARAACRRAR